MKPEAAFAPDITRGEPQRQCRECRNDARLRNRHGLTREELAERKRDKRCAICGRLDGDNAKALHLDHDHVGGRPRGWLCSQHNVALGMFEDNVEHLRAAIAYLEAHATS